MANYFAEAGRVHRLYGVLRAEVNVVHVQGRSGYADAVRDLVVLLQPDQGGRCGVRSKQFAFVRRFAIMVMLKLMIAFAGLAACLVHSAG